MATEIIFPEVEVPPEVLSLLPSNGLTKDELEDMDEEEWKAFSEILKPKVPFGSWMRLTRSFKARHNILKNIEDQRALKEGVSEPILHQIIEKAAVKLFVDGGSCVGTFIFISPDTGICAHHEVYSENTGTKESTLRVEKDSSMKFLFCFPKYDVAVYKVEGRQGSYFRLGRTSDLYEGNHIILVSFPLLDSQGRDDEEEEATFTFGRISIKSKRQNPLLMLGQYPSFPNSSGGAVVSKTGQLLGLHLERSWKIPASQAASSS